jgi:dolichol-phosphate mannosyltransferase
MSYCPGSQSWLDWDHQSAGHLTRTLLKMKSLVVIPTYNEADNLGRIVAAIYDALPQTSVLVIDDASPDGTGKLADDLAARHPSLRVLHRGGKEGLGSAYIAGFRYALDHDYECVFAMDADFSHDPRYLPALLEAAGEADLVIGSRYVPGGRTPDWGISRRIISGFGNVYARNLLRLPIRDCTAGLKCYRRTVLEAFDLQAICLEGYAFQIETVYQAHCKGFRIAEVPIVFPDRKVGKSKMSRAIVSEAFTYVICRRVGGRAQGMRGACVRRAAQLGEQRHGSRA